MSMETPIGRVFFVARSGRMRSAARLLAEVLLRPGVRIVGPDDLPGRVRPGDAIVDFDPPSEKSAWVDETGIRVSLQDGEPSREPVVCRVPGGRRVRLTSRRIDVEVDNGFRSALSLRNRAAAMLTMAARRYNKSNDSLRASVRLEFQVGLELLGRVARPSAVDRIASLFDDGDRSSNDPVSWFDPRLEEWIESAGEVRCSELKQFVEDPAPSSFGRFRSLFLRMPALMVLGGMRASGSRRPAWAEFLRSLAPHLTTGGRICGMLGGTLAIEDEAILDRMIESTRSTIWSFDDSALLRLSPGRENIDRSVLSALVHVSLAARSGVPLDAILPRRRIASLRWHGFGPKEIEDGVEPASLRFYEPERGRLAKCLVENWLLLLEQRSPESGHFDIQSEHYDGSVEAIEHLLGCVVDDLQLRASGRAIRLLPWPRGCDSALSIRYDVDRPVETGVVSGLVDLQRRLLGAEAGSWFLLDRAEHSSAVIEDLVDTDQEIGAHVCDPMVDPVDGNGVTVHSSQRSRYWEGRRTLDALTSEGALYGESMQFTAIAPRRAWMGDEVGRMWCTPLHFPLEGSVDQADLTYFQRHREAFDRIREQGGHVIIGAHPDCDPGLMREVLVGFARERIWAAPLGEVVARMKAISTPGSLELRFRRGHLEARAEADVLGLVIEVIESEGRRRTHTAERLTSSWMRLLDDGDR